MFTLGPRARPLPRPVSSWSLHFPGLPRVDPSLLPRGNQTSEKGVQCSGNRKTKCLLRTSVPAGLSPATQPRTTRVGRVPQRGGIFPVPPLCAARSFPAPQRIHFPDLSLIRRSPFLPGLLNFALWNSHGEAQQTRPFPTTQRVPRDSLRPRGRYSEARHTSPSAIQRLRDQVTFF